MDSVAFEFVVYNNGSSYTCICVFMYNTYMHASTCSYMYAGLRVYLNNPYPVPDRGTWSKRSPFLTSQDPTLSAGP